MATREAATDTDLAEDIWTSGGSNPMASATHTATDNGLFVSWVCCAIQKTSATSAVPIQSWTAFGTREMVDLRNLFDYSLAFTSEDLTYGPSAGGGTDVVAVENLGT